MNTIEIGGREIPLQFTMAEMAAFEEEIGFLSDAEELMQTGRGRVRNIAKAIRIMGNGALAAQGDTPDLTEDWLLKNMRPAQLVGYITGVFGAVTDGMRMETEEDRERDLVLEEIQRKKEKGD